jgi:hypothetical protein
MQHGTMRFPCRLVSFTLLAAAASLSAHAAATADVGGQWIGNSWVEGGRGATKSTLALAAPDADESTFSIEDRSSCTLKRGSYSAAGDDAWSLTFKEARGSDACERLAKGTFTLRAGSKPRTLDLEVTYPGPDGQPNVRRGTLTRYP